MKDCTMHSKEYTVITKDSTGTLHDWTYIGLESSWHNRNDVLENLSFAGNDVDVENDEVILIVSGAESIQLLDTMLD